MTNSSAPYSYDRSLKSDLSDELLNTYLLRPIAGLVVRFVFPTPLTPNHLTLIAIAFGFLSAWFYLLGTAGMTLLAGLLLTTKDILDSADGQLARARNQYSRAGRFLDSIGDIVVNFLVFTSITLALYQSTGSWVIIPLGAMSFIYLTLRVSFHVFYQTSYLHLNERYLLNRVTEEVRQEDLRREDRTELLLHRIFQFFYGWQDRLMVRLDRWCLAGLPLSKENQALWYGDRIALRGSGLLGLGTELFLLMICSVLNVLELYLMLNLVLMNGVWLGTMLYRRFVLVRKIRSLPYSS